MNCLNMKHIEGGNLEPRWMVNGVRVSKSTFESLTFDADRIDSFLTIIDKNDRTSHYKTAYVPNWAVRTILSEFTIN